MKLNKVLAEYESLIESGDIVNEKHTKKFLHLLELANHLCDRFHINSKTTDAKYNSIVKHINQQHNINENIIKESEEYLNLCLNIATKHKKELKVELDKSKQNKKSTLELSTTKIFSLYVSLNVVIILLKNIMEVMTFNNMYNKFMKLYEWIIIRLLKIKNSNDMNEIKQIYKSIMEKKIQKSKDINIIKGKSNAE